MMKKATRLAMALLLAYGQAETIILSTANDIIEFASNVNSGVLYIGSTVLLDKDIDFAGLSDQFMPIGQNWNTYFQGTFDGQGHTISNLNITTSSFGSYGLFGYSWGTTVRSVVMDSSCSVDGSKLFGRGDGSSDNILDAKKKMMAAMKKKNGGEPYYVDVGGIFGECEGFYAQCNIENCINMGKNVLSYVSPRQPYDDFDGRVGGIAGSVYAYDYVSTVKNCANYGSVTFSGEVDYSDIGGVLGSTARRDYPQLRPPPELP